MSNSVGPASEQLAPAQRESPEKFLNAVGTIADGALVFPVPFDLASAAALAGNDIAGEDAVCAASAAHTGTTIRYHVQISQVVDGQSDLRREVVDAVVDQDQLRPLLRDALRNVTTPE